MCTFAVVEKKMTTATGQGTGLSGNNNTFPNRRRRTRDHRSEENGRDTVPRQSRTDSVGTRTVLSTNGVMLEMQWIVSLLAAYRRPVARGGGGGRLCELVAAQQGRQDLHMAFRDLLHEASTRHASLGATWLGGGGSGGDVAPWPAPAADVYTRYHHHGTACLPIAFPFLS